MLRSLRLLASVACLAGVVIATAGAATPEEEAARAVAQAWIKAVTGRDVDAQMKLLPPTMFAKSADHERARHARVYDKEVALIRNQRYEKFDLGLPAQTMKVGKTTAVVIPYKSIVSSLDGKLQIDSSLVALNVEGSSQWSVFDGAGHTVRTLKVIIPGYVSGLNIPPATSKVVKE